MKKRNGYKMLIRKFKEKKTYWNKDNIKLHIKIECEGADWIRLLQDRIDWKAFISSVINNDGFVD